MLTGDLHKLQRIKKSFNVEKVKRRDSFELLTGSVTRETRLKLRKIVRPSVTSDVSPGMVFLEWDTGIFRSSYTNYHFYYHTVPSSCSIKHSQLATNKLKSINISQ